ncbi:mechanosensitive ion channel protein MscS [Denitratisoma sp. DHT3]|uniref:mechanosensitive ion channel family protein n=1 Tax=Denitratisoma sp. DHT3 TaxID=1981880 RepID=UPI001198B830|nr:mechanosensitive ion channel family protein [Denitratisoma sp. DHT3]QDX79995.1 mechanosensitive ion channel protein MscS [Denitratisoma sp. DHT3]
MNQLFDVFVTWLPGNLERPVRILLILVLSWMAMHTTHRIIPRLRETIVSRQGSREDGQRIRTLSRVIRYTLTVMVTVISGLLILGEFGISVAPILGAAGVVGIAVGFGAQSLVKDYFNGFFLLLENQIRIGDVVEAGGKGGVVEELTLRYLRLRDYSGNVHYIPNGEISIVTNMSLGFAYAVIDVGVAYGEDIDHVTAVMRRVGDQMRCDPGLSGKILDDLEVAGVESWADSSVVIRCRFRVAPLEQWSVRREYLRRLKQAFDQEEIEIPFPHIKVVSEMQATALGK